jgi:hypothetical protein
MKQILALSAIAVFALAACGKSEDKTITLKDPQTGEKVDVSVNGADKGTMTLKTDQGSLVINSGDNATVPDGVDVYPGAKVQSSMTGFGAAMGAAGGNAGSMVAMTTKDAPATVLAFYKTKFAAKGWKINMESSTPDGGMISAGGDPAKPGALVTASVANGETTVSVMMGK